MEDMKSESCSSLLFFFTSSPLALASASLSAKKPALAHAGPPIHLCCSDPPSALESPETEHFSCGLSELLTPVQ